MCELPITSAVSVEFKESTRSRIPLLKTLFLVLALLVLFDPTLLAQQGAKPKSVLVLSSTRSTSPVAYQWDRGIRSVFKAGPSDQIVINIEYLDSSRFNDDRYIQLLRDLYRHKYSNSKPDLIIPVYNQALEFVLGYEQAFFTGVPVVFGAVERHFVESRSLGPNITGILSGNMYKDTLDLALNLHPDTRRVTVVAGAGSYGRSYDTAARKVFRLYEGRIDFSYLTGLPMEALLKKVAHLPAQTLVMYLPLLEDGAGKKFNAPESLSQISRASNAPVYGFWDVLLGHGIVGGYLNSFEEQGKMVAQLGVRILNGEKPADIPIIQAPKFQNMFDWRQLKRWSISEDSLPPGSIVKFKELTVWEEHKGQIIGALALILFQTLIISYLLHQRRIRRQTEYQLKDRLQFEHKLSELSSEFINLSSEELDSKMIDALAWIGPFMRADRSHMFRFNWDRTEFRITHLWEAEGIKKDDIVLPGLIVKDAFPWLFDNLIGGRDIIVPDVEIIFDEKSINEYQYCRTIGIQSFIIQPIEIENAPLCAIGLDSIRQKRQWPQEIQDRLRIMGEIFANTIVRRHAEKKSEEAALRYRTVADFTYDWEYWQNPDGSLQYISPSCERISGYSVQDFMDNPALLQEIIVPQDKEIWDEHYCASENELKPREIQLRIQRPDGEIRWIEHVCQPVVDNKGSLAGFRASNRDITERKQAELELQGAYGEIKELKVQLETESAYLQEEIKLEHNFENIIGQSEELKYVLYQVEQVAATDSSVLILGETGTGKELVARAIHKLSSRSNRVLVKVNCAALPAELIESELFGREKGAFTGATATQIGRFELAKGSTILLDEIGELPLTLQAKLLRVYESGEFERLGNPKTLYSDARIIAATNRALEDEVRQGRFREDLWYRLKVFTVTLPPLRQRKADIPLLIKWFMDQLSRKMGKPAVEIPKHTMQALQGYHWPGNVRELKNMVESALITARGNKMNLELPNMSAPAISDFKPFEEMERDYILQVLKAKNWKVQGTNSAASILGMNPNTLRARIKKLGIKKQAPQ
jgi:PAS domain S-box-containing protein